MPAQEALVDAKRRLEPHLREEIHVDPTSVQRMADPEGTPAADLRALVSRDVSDFGDCLQPRAGMERTDEETKS
jgi:hypothetical protein